MKPFWEPKNLIIANHLFKASCKDISVSNNKAAIENNDNSITKDDIQSMKELAGDLCSKKDYVKAIPLLEEVVKLLTNKLGPTHESTMLRMNNLISTYRRNRNHMTKLYQY